MIGLFLLTQNSYCWMKSLYLQNFTHCRKWEKSRLVCLVGWFDDNYVRVFFSACSRKWMTVNSSKNTQQLSIIKLVCEVCFYFAGFPRHLKIHHSKKKKNVAANYSQNQWEDVSVALFVYMIHQWTTAGFPLQMFLFMLPSLLISYDLRLLQLHVIHLSPVIWMKCLHHFCWPTENVQFK